MVVLALKGVMVEIEGKGESWKFFKNKPDGCAKRCGKSGRRMSSQTSEEVFVVVDYDVDGDDDGDKNDGTVDDIDWCWYEHYGYDQGETEDGNDNIYSHWFLG